jgi:hypothetical protein
MRLAEAAVEVPGGGGVGDAMGAQGIKVDLVEAPWFDVLEPFAAGGRSPRASITWRRVSICARSIRLYCERRAARPGILLRGLIRSIRMER